MSDINQVIDNLGRRINVFVEDIGSLSGQITSASVAIGKAVDFIGDKSKSGGKGKESSIAGDLKAQIDRFENIAARFGNIIGKIDEEIEQGKETASKIGQFIEALKNEKRQRKGPEDSAGSFDQKVLNVLNGIQSTFKAGHDALEEQGSQILQHMATTSKTMERGQTPGSMYVHDTHVEKKINELKKVTNDVKKAIGSSSIPGIPSPPKPPAPPGAPPSGPPPSGPTPMGSGGFSDDEIRKIADSISGRATDEFGDGIKRRAASWATEISTLLMGGYGDIGQVLFAGSVRDITDFRKEARSLAFEVQGINASTREMQAEFTDMGEVARRTGKSMDVMQKLYMANMRKGFKNQGKELKSVLKSGMHLSTMIGSNVDETGSMFADWNRMLGMSTHQMNQLASDAKNIALSTGVTGDELLGAMKSSEAILKNLRNQGNLTSASAKNVIQAMAEAKKLGIEDKASGVMDMMTSTNKFLEGDAATQRFIVSMVGNVPGGTDAALGGTLMDDPNMLKGMMSEMNSTIDRFTGGAAKSIKDIDKLSRDDRMKLSVMLKQSFGMEIYEFESMFKVFEDQTKTLAERFSDLEEVTKNNTKTQEEQKLAFQQMNDLMIGSGMTLANKFAHATSKLKDQSEFQAAMARTSSEMTDAEKLNMAHMKEQAMKSTAEGGLGMTDADFAKTASFGASKDYADSLLVAAAAMKKQGKDKGIDVEDLGPEILKAFESGQVTDIKAVQEKIAEQQQKLGIKEKTSVDAITELGQEVNALNETIRKLVSGPFGVLIDVIGWVGLALTQVGLAVGVMYMRMGSLTKVFESMSGTMARLGTGLSDIQSGIGSAFNRLIGTKTKVKGFGFGGSLETSNIFSRMADRFADFFDDVGKRGFMGLWDNIVSGFNWVRGKIWGAMKWVGESIGNFFTKKLNLGGFFNKIGGIFKAKDGTTGIKALALNAKDMFGAFRKGGGILKGVSGIFRGLSTAARANPVGFFLFAAIDGVMGAVEGYMSAAKIFGVETKDLTTGMKISAGAAGGLVGILDGLTFGMLRMSGLARPLEEIFANIIYGFMWMGEGIKNGFMSWLPTIMDSFGMLGTAVGDLFGQIASIFGFDVESTGQKWDAFFKIMENIGWFIGNVFGAALNGIVIILWAVIKAVQAVVWVFQVLFKVISAIGSFIGNIFVGAFKLVSDALYNITSIGTVFQNAWMGIVNWFTSLPGKILDGMIALIPNWAKRLMGISSGPTGGTGAPPATPQVALADGGITTGPTNALIGEAGPEAVIPLDKLGGVMGQNKIAGDNFNQEKSLATHKKTNDVSMSSNGILKNIERVIKRGGNASEGLFVHDLKSGLMLSLIFSHMNMLITMLDTLLNFMAEKDPELMMKSRAFAQADGVDRMATATHKLDYGARKNMRMVDFMSNATSNASANMENVNNKGQPWKKDQFIDPEFEKRKSSSVDRTNYLLKQLHEPIQEFSDEATHKGSIWTHDPYVEKQAKLSRKEIPEAIWDSEDKIADAMEKQTEAYAHGQGFEKSAEMASVDGLKARGIESIQYGIGSDGKILTKSIEEAMNEANAQLDNKARARYKEDSKGQIAALDSEISKLHKQVMDESKKAGMHTAVTDMPSYKAWSEAQKKREEFRSGVVPERYFKEDTMMAARPDEDPSMLYETQKEALDHALAEKTKKIEQEKTAVAALESELNTLKKELNAAKQHASTGGFDPWAEVKKKSLEARIADIEGGGKQGTVGVVDHGSLEAARSRLEIAQKREIDPRNVKRRTIGKKYWSGDSDTSVVFPDKLPDGSSGWDRAVEWRHDSGKRLVDGKMKENAELQHRVEVWGGRPWGGENKSFGNDASDLTYGDEFNRRVLDNPFNKDWHPKHSGTSQSEWNNAKPLPAFGGGAWTPPPMSVELQYEDFQDGWDRAEPLPAFRSGAWKPPPMVQPSDAAVSASSAMEVSSTNLATPVGQHAVPVMRDEEDGVASVQPVALNDIGESILRDRAGGGNGKLQSDELARMEEVAQNQYAETQRMREVMELVASYLKPSDTVGSGPEQESRSRATKRQVRPNIFGQIANKNGKPGGGPNRSNYNA